MPGGQLVSNAVAREVSASVWETEALGGRPQSPNLDGVAWAWSKALESAHSALGVAGPYLSGEELGERTQRLAEERRKVARLLECLARDLQADSGFLSGLAAPWS
jgi:hypothetical protein